MPDQDTAPGERWGTLRSTSGGAPALVKRALVILTCVLLAFTAFPSPADPVMTGSPKKGVGYWVPRGDRVPQGGEGGLKSSGATWCYDWGTKPQGTLPDGVEFVPMIWDERHVNAEDLKTAKANGKVLLGFNEPDAKNQADMTVEEALKLWPQLEATGMRLGSPATAHDSASEGRWFSKFMDASRSKGYRVDFICVHHYCDNYTDAAVAAADLKASLQRIYALYKKPIWLTEFALSNWSTPATGAQQEAFIKAAVPVLESLPFVERYAWFALPPFKGDKGALANANLCDESGVLNARGAAFRAAK